MKQPDEIKKGLNCNNIDHCSECPYDGLDCAKHVDQDAFAYIQQLESAVEFYSNTAQMLDAKIDKLQTRLAQAERERDAAIADCSRFPCATCSDKANGDLCRYCNVRKDTTRTNYEWRGVCEENTKDGADA